MIQKKNQTCVEIILDPQAKTRDLGRSLSSIPIELTQEQAKAISDYIRERLGCGRIVGFICSVRAEFIDVEDK